MFFDEHIGLFHVDAKNQEEVLTLMANELYKKGIVKIEYLPKLLDREKYFPTGIMVKNTGFAIPHTDSVFVNRSQIMFASLLNPINFKNMVDKNKEVPVSLIFMIAMSKPHEQVETLSNLINMFQNEKMVAELKNCKSIGELSLILNDENLAEI
ncbi:PTS sugar transporter subunit IIA [Heyndrickxia acidiproducens]|uniref:PTS sugar transporter subunit IIA n=1 Tax=Heyndrickxia acidiproducens TaxID=1121084 RepID=UPI000371F739|nr:PTS sugar transporter subunit IIA [Heyndrickxia acidiproducens]